CERVLELDQKLPGILSGQQQPANVAERIALAELCQMPCKKRYLAALRFYEEAFVAEPKLTADRPSIARYNAACAAALASGGQGEDANGLDEPQCARLRPKALAWLRADLEAWKNVFAKESEKERPVIQQQMQHWQQDTDFADVRGPEALAKLP